MSTRSWIQSALLPVFMFAAPAFAQDQPVEKAPAPTQAELEAAFAAKLSGAKLVGHFTDGATTGQRNPESYSLGTVAKVEGTKWRFEAIVEYGGKTFPLPIVLDVLWAGDTPVITMTDRKIPMVGTFTCRVMIFEDHYLGVWDGGDHGGQMYGRVVAGAGEPLEGGAQDAGAGDDQDASGEGEQSDAAQESDKQASAQSAAAEVVRAVPAAVRTDDEPDTNWPQFRGPQARGVADGFETPISWDIESGESIYWRTPIPGLAHSSPVIHGNRLFLTTAIKDGEPAELRVGLYGDIGSVKDEGPHTFQLMCLDKRSGKVLWTHDSWKGVPKWDRHPKSSYAVSSPASDGEYVLAFYGQEGLYCYDMEGELKWSKTFGDLDSGFFMVKDAQWGFGSSPVIHDGRVFLQCDVQEGSFVAALELESGDEIWRTARAEVPTWGSPAIDIREGRKQVICNGWKHIGGYDYDTGAELWKLVGGGDIPVPTPIVAHDLIFITSAHGRQAPIYAIDAMATGEITTKSEAMKWSLPRRGNYMQTPIVYGDLIYCCSDSGILRCYEAKTGESVYDERLSAGGGGFSASGIAADGKLYFTNEDGNIHVIQAGREFRELYVNEMGEECMATPAVSEGVMYWRTRSHLVAVGL